MYLRLATHSGLFTRRNQINKELHMRKLTAVLALSIFSIGAHAQNMVNPVTGIRWPQATGNGAPPSASCTAAHYGQPYVNLTPTGTDFTYYVCTTTGWTGNQGPAGPAGPTGPSGVGNATEIQGIPISTTPPLPGQSQVYNGTEYAPGVSAAASTGAAQDIQLSGGLGSPIIADDSAQVLPDHSLVTLGPRVSVRDSLFATGSGIPASPGRNCVGVDSNPTGLADPTDTYNSECAIRNAGIFAANTSYGTLHPTLYFPFGKYLVNVAGTTGVLQFNVPVAVAGDAQISSVIDNRSPQAATLTYVSVYGAIVNNIGLFGAGHTTTGDMLDVLDSQASDIEHVTCNNSAGECINLQGSSERTRMHDINAAGVRQVLNSEGNTNEDYLDGFDFTFNGYTTVDNWFFDSNANPLTGSSTTNACLATPTAYSASTAYTTGQTVTETGVTFNAAQASINQTPQLWSAYWNECGQSRFPEERAVVYMDGDNWHAQNGSIKATKLSGANLARFTSFANNVYFEADSSGTISSPAYSFQVVGKMEIGHLTSELPAAGLTAGVDDAGWQHQYTTDPTLVSHTVTDNAYYIFPTDYLYGSSAASVSNPNLLRGQYEQVYVAGFANDGQNNGFQGSAHLSGRAENGTVAPGVACSGSVTTACGAGLINAAVDWPAPTTPGGILTFSALISQQANSTYGVIDIANDHLEMLHIVGTDYANCSDTVLRAPNAQWIGNPSELCAEVLLGAAPDGLTLQEPTVIRQTYNNEGVAEFKDNTIFQSSLPEVSGFGQIKIANSGEAIINMGNVPLKATLNPATAFLNYTNLNVSVDTVNYGSVSAISTVIDPSAGYISSNQGAATSPFNSLRATIQDAGGGNTFSTQTISAIAPCQYYSSTSDSAAPTTRTCLSKTGFNNQTYNGSAWVVVPDPTTVVELRDSGQIPSGYKDVYLFNSTTGSTDAVILPVCSTTVNYNNAMNIYRGDPEQDSLVVITPPTGTTFSIDGSLTGSSTTSALYMPNGANWRAVCTDKVNGYATWAIYSNQSGFSYPNVVLYSSQAGTVTPANFTSTSLTGQIALTLTTAAPAYSQLYTFTSSSPGFVQYNSAFVQSEATQTTPSIQFGTGYFSLTGNSYVVFAPAAGLPAGSYTLQYLNRTF
jgi:hypothetical protein